MRAPILSLSLPGGEADKGRRRCWVELCDDPPAPNWLHHPRQHRNKRLREQQVRVPELLTTDAFWERKDGTLRDERKLRRRQALVPETPSTPLYIRLIVIVRIHIYIYIYMCRYIYIFLPEKYISVLNKHTQNVKTMAPPSQTSPLTVWAKDQSKSHHLSHYKRLNISFL